MGVGVQLERGPSVGGLGSLLMGFLGTPSFPHPAGAAVRTQAPSTRIKGGAPGSPWAWDHKATMLHRPCGPDVAIGHLGSPNVRTAECLREDRGPSCPTSWPRHTSSPRLSALRGVCFKLQTPGGARSVPGLRRGGRRRRLPHSRGGREGGGGESAAGVPARGRAGGAAGRPGRTCRRSALGSSRRKRSANSWKA